MHQSSIRTELEYKFDACAPGVTSRLLEILGPCHKLLEQHNFFFLTSNSQIVRLRIEKGSHGNTICTLTRKGVSVQKGACFSRQEEEIQIHTSLAHELTKNNTPAISDLPPVLGKANQLQSLGQFRNTRMIWELYSFEIALDKAFLPLGINWELEFELKGNSPEISPLQLLESWGLTLPPSREGKFSRMQKQMKSIR